MNEKNIAKNPLHAFLPIEVEGFDALAELALDLRWSWNDAADEIWRELDPVLWELTHNPWVVLQTVARDRLQRFTADPAFREKVDGFVRAMRGKKSGDTILNSLTFLKIKPPPSIQLTKAAFDSIDIFKSTESTAILRIA